VLANRR